MNIGFIGYGEAGFNISLGLAQEGINGIHATDAMMNHDVMGNQVRNRAKEAGVTLIDSNMEIAKWADIIFVAVPSSFSFDVCNDIKEHLHPSQLYIELSSSTPANKEGIWESIKETGVLFVDATMLGSLTKDKHKVPIIASGNGADKFLKIMTRYGMDITLVGENPGAASAIKLVRSIFMKGIAALMIDMLLAAEAYGVADEVVYSIGKSLDGIPFSSHLDRLVTGTALHCNRRANELMGSIDMQREAGLSPVMTMASKDRHDALSKYEFAARYVDSSPSTWREIIDIIKINN